MNISARITSGCGEHNVSLRTGAREQSLTIPPKQEGAGSSVNGGELLFLALATCYCNDICREAAKRKIEVQRVEVEVTGTFGREGEGAKEIRYRASLDTKAPREQVLALIHYTDTVAEIHNTLRASTPVVLYECDTHEV